MRTKEQYIEGLKKKNPNLYFNGKKIDRLDPMQLPKEPGSLTAEEVKAFLKERIAKYKIPEYVEFMTEFPLNATGKIMKTNLENVPK